MASVIHRWLRQYIEAETRRMDLDALASNLTTQKVAGHKPSLTIFDESVYREIGKQVQGLRGRAFAYIPMADPYPTQTKPVMHIGAGLVIDGFRVKPLSFILQPVDFTPMTLHQKISARRPGSFATRKD